MSTLTSVLIINYDIQLIYEELIIYGEHVSKKCIKEIYFLLNCDVVDVIIYFLENKSNILINE